jgi:hypothetical protein
MYLALSDLVVSNCLVRGNIVDSWRESNAYGGGIYALNAGLVTHCIISANTNECDAAGSEEDAFGGGLYLVGTDVRNCLVVDNDAHHTGSGGAHGDGALVNGGTVLIEASTVADNHGQGISHLGGTLSVRNAILWGNGDDVAGGGTPAIEHSNVEDGDNVGADGCISSDPQFADAAAGDYRLLTTSPCVNAGTNRSWMIAGVDLDGGPRLENEIVDMGAYETFLPPVGTIFVVR